MNTEPQAAGGQGWPPPNPALTFASFVEGPPNGFAKAAASEVASNPGESHNPLLLYGGVGLGKTHLLHAVGNQILASRPEAKVACQQSERFINDMIPDDVALYMAERVRSNVRELEGALRRVLAHARFNDSPVTVDLVNLALGDLLTICALPITVERIQKVVADYYRTKIHEMMSKSRRRAIAKPRQIAMSLCKQFTDHSLSEIGERFGGRTDTTVLGAYQRVKELRETDAEIAEDYKILTQRLSQ